MSLELIFELELDSDYHISAGHGRGGLVDSALQRDADGVPVLRGTTLVGLLRDALAQLIQEPALQNRNYALCQSSGRPPKDATGQDTPRFCRAHELDDICPVCRLFGSPARRKRWRISSARPVEALIPSAQGWPLQVGTQIVPHVRVNPRTRRAEARKLFSREEGDRRWRFRFTAACDAEDDAALQEAIWLVAAARYLRHLGAGRRRGRGACYLHLVDNPALQAHLPARSDGESCEAWFLSQFEQRFLAPSEKPAVASSATRCSPTFQPSASTDQTPVQLLLLARLDEPVIMAERSEVGNELRSLDYISGTVLRGALAARVAGRYDLENKKSAAFAAFERLFLRGQVLFTHLYPVQVAKDTLYPAIPAPRDLYSCELYPGFDSESYSSHGARGLAQQDPQQPVASECGCEGCRAALKSLGGYWSLNPRPSKVEPRRTYEVHPRIHPITRRAASGALFGYEALAPGQYLLGELTCANRAAWEDLASLADLPLKKAFQLRLGKATGSGYGQTMVWIEERLPQDMAIWCPAPINARVTDPGAPLTLTLLTDAILCDPWGRFVTCLDKAWLEGLLGLQVQPLRAFCASRALDSFNAYLGLPRWRDITLCAGSAIGFKLAQEVDLPTLRSKLESIERDGIGLRRNEGLGRVAFNHPLYQGCDSIKSFYVKPDSRPGMGLSDAAKGSALYQEQLFRAEWERKIEEIAPDRKSLQDDEFAAVARLIRHKQPGSEAELDRLLDDLGCFKNVLPADLVDKELDIRSVEARGNRFAQKKGAPGIGLIKTLARALQELCKNQAGITAARCWQIGLEVLTECVAAEAQKGDERDDTHAGY